jgi:uncharacterized protein YndB with AHSA1/START domain
MEAKPADHIRIEIRIEASLQKVWEAWTDPDIILQWIGSEPESKGLSAELQVHPGGKFEIHFLSSDQTEHVCFGVYREVVAYNKLSFSWQWKSEPDVESLVSLSLKPVGQLTLMHFEHRGVGYQSAHNYTEGWKGAFLKLNKLLQKAEN